MKKLLINLLISLLMLVAGCILCYLSFEKGWDSIFWEKSQGAIFFFMGASAIYFLVSIILVLAVFLKRKLTKHKNNKK